MVAKFNLFRLSVLVDPQNRLFPDYDSKEDYIYKKFSKNHEFFHRKIQFFYVFLGEVKGKIIGRIGRETKIDYNSSPDQGFEKSSMPVWRASTIVLDPGGHVDGHKLAVEEISTLGRSDAILNSLISFVNQENDSIYSLVLNPIVASGRFFDFVEEVGSPVSFLSITFTPPNGLWSADSNAKDEVKRVSEKTNATQIKTVISNKKGLDLTSEDLKESISYAESGSGNIRAKAVNGRSFSSDKAQESVFIDVSGAASDDDVKAAVMANPNYALGQ